MCSELCKDFYVVYQLEMVAGEVESSCELVVTFFFFFGLTLPNYRNKSGSAQRSPPSYQLLPPPLCLDVCCAFGKIMNNNRPPASNFQKSERETGNQVSLALDCIIIVSH